MSEKTTRLCFRCSKWWQEERINGFNLCEDCCRAIRAERAYWLQLDAEEFAAAAERLYPKGESDGK